MEGKEKKCKGEHFYVYDGVRLDLKCLRCGHVVKMPSKETIENYYKHK